MSVPTPHISAKVGDFAKTVLMPGDPLRAKFIADTFLKNKVLVNNVRGVQGYTGDYEGKRVSVMASGMGMPSIGIYSYELFNFYGVENIIRVGTAGAIDDGLKLKDIVFGMGACTTSNYFKSFNINGNFAPICSFDLLRKAVQSAEKTGKRYSVGNLLSSDVFYCDLQDTAAWKKMGVLAVEMEAAALYMNALASGKNALAICTISDCPLKGDSCSSEERQTAFTDMMKIALDIA